MRDFAKLLETRIISIVLLYPDIAMPPAHTLAHYLQTADTLRAYTRQAQRLTEVAQALARILPPAVRHGARPACWNAGTLVITTDNGAIAAKLKQLTPDLLFKLKNQGHEVSAIRIAVQVRESRAVPQSPRPLSSPDPASWRSLADSLEPGNLKNAIERLLAQRS
ncbi:MAG: DciA family protein [Pseudomonadota bacterium]